MKQDGRVTANGWWAWLVASGHGGESGTVGCGGGRSYG